MKKNMTAGVALLAAGIAQAAVITWQPSVNMYQGSTVETFVNTAGTTAVAYNNTPDAVNGNVTVNGVAFTQTLVGNTLVGTGGESITINGGTDNASAFGDGEFSSNGNIYHLIQGATYEVNSITLGGLQTGQEYLIQVFNNDARGTRNLNFVVGYDDGNGSATQDGTSQLNNSPVDGSSPIFPETDAGDSILGTFTADAATMTINVYGSGNGGASWATAVGQSQINAIQLRAIPEPATLGLVAAFGGAILFIRRRFKI